MATIIKTHGGHSASGPTLRGAAYDLTDMAAQADQYLAQIRTEAIKIVEQARQEAASVKQQAEAAGKKAAEAAIERILDEKVAQQMRTLTPALQAAAKQVEDAQAGVAAALGKDGDRSGGGDCRATGARRIDAAAGDHAGVGPRVVATRGGDRAT